MNEDMSASFGHEKDYSPACPIWKLLTYLCFLSIKENKWSFCLLRRIENMNMLDVGATNV